MSLTFLGPIEFRGLRRTYLPGLRVTLASLRHHHPTARIVVFNRSVEYEPIAALLRRFDVESLDVRAFDAQRGIPDGWFAHTRQLAYAAWIREQRDLDQVVCLDLIDSVCQGPVVIPDDFVIAQESQTIRQSAYNQHYLTMSYPRDTWARFLDQPVLCSGVVSGTPEGVLRLYDDYAEDIGQRPDIRRDLGVDQAHLMVYAYQPSHKVRILPYANPVFMHVGSAPAGSIRYAAGRVVCDGVVPTLVHQYNRHPDVQIALEGQWT